MINPNALHDQATSLPALIKEQTWRLEDDLRKSVPTPVQHAIRHIVLTGSGDSAIAGLAAEQTFRRFVGVPVYAGESLAVSRFLLDSYGNEYPHTPMLLATSNSGEVARVVEAAQRAAAAGGYVVGLTGNAQSRLARASQSIIDVGAPAFPAAPGMRSYVMAVLALNLFAIRFAEVRGRITMDEAQALRGELAGLSDVVQQAIVTADAPLRSLAQDWRDLQGVEFLGSGPSRASAAFGVAKILEAVGKQSAHVDLEEFIHLNYFERAATGIGTVVLAPAGSPVRSRADELAPLLNNLGRPWVAIGAVTDAPVSIEIPQVREEFAPVVQAAVLGLLAAHLMDATGEEPGRGAVGPWADCADGATTRDSQIVL
ncbi:SIS domain-containing protein [Occultella aeris]|uniref:Glutamine--fructose-6-phosphate aminotransferase [isomerizing] n=1 Tax=Occultella aeris TaxID=2761496 RepID=A0A7M4DGS8_9MICO|nr:SIS domain-containing protein [Occultella aeris]VZO36121.1 Glutamine--fructose-6-phosphate aminotransferase [isomerizing] [Occultella aeris]